MKLLIELTSDLCTSSGENYNAYIDTDVVYDEYGFPYIPAKRLKGVLKEAALELVEFGLFEKVDYEKLFGTEGAGNALFTIDNGYLENIEQYIEDIIHCGNSPITHPQRVLGLYTYTRTQTALEKSGVAKENSLRTFRVVNKGEKFAAQINELYPLASSQKELLLQAAKMVKHIGNSRTRGLGQVEMNILEDNNIQSDSNKKFSVYDKNCISYKISLKGPLLCKTSDGNQGDTETFLAGNKILGILAGILGTEKYEALMGAYGERKEVIISNAYICQKEQRCTPIPVSYQKKKDQVYVDGQMAVKDMLSGYMDEEQWTPVGTGYISPDGYIKNIETQINYHHKRPNNKAVGRANSKDNSSFYQLKSICKNQSFAGYILADREQTEIILNAMGTQKNIRIGNNKNTEYGQAVLEITDVNPCNKKTINLQKFAVKLNAPAILYNENGMPDSDIITLKSYVENALDITEGELQLKKCFVTYEEIGGFNVTWHRRKPYFSAIGKGSVFFFECAQEREISVNDILHIGERILEGYGEIELLTQIEEDIFIKKYQDNRIDDNYNYRTNIVERLEYVQRVIDLKEAARAAADERAASLIEKLEFTATLGKIILLSKVVPDFSAMEEQIQGIETKSKKELAENILKGLKENKKDPSQQELFTIMLPEYLIQLKYKARMKKGENKNE